VKTKVDGITFDSRKEAARYLHLKLLQKAGKISDLRCQYPFKIIIDGMHVCTYKADFVYADVTTEKTHGMRVITVEDVKGVKTAIYRLKKKLVKAVYRLDIMEV